MQAIRKKSKKRDAILTAICSTTSHPSAQWVYEAVRPVIPDLSLGTVYRNLNQFVEDGRIQSVGIVDGEERFDGNAAPHPHFICEFCGNVIDLDMHDHDFGSGIVKNMQGHEINFMKTVFHGVCKSCQSR